MMMNKINAVSQMTLEITQGGGKPTVYYRRASVSYTQHRQLAVQ
jgi:hypothetical protein